MYGAMRVCYVLWVAMVAVVAQEVSPCRFIREEGTRGTQTDWSGFRVLADLNECEKLCLSSDSCVAVEFTAESECYTYAVDTLKSSDKDTIFLTKVCLDKDPAVGEVSASSIQPSATVSGLDASASQALAALASAFPDQPKMDHLLGIDDNSTIGNDSLPSIDVAASMNDTDGSDSMGENDTIAGSTSVSPSINGSMTDNATQTIIGVPDVSNGTIDANATASLGNETLPDGNGSLGIIPASSGPSDGVNTVQPSPTDYVSIETPDASAPVMDTTKHIPLTGVTASIAATPVVETTLSVVSAADVTTPLPPKAATIPNSVITTLPLKTKPPPVTKPPGPFVAPAVTQAATPLTTGQPVPPVPPNPQYPYNPYPYPNQPQVPGPNGTNPQRPVPYPPQYPYPPYPGYQPNPYPQYPQYPPYQPRYPYPYPQPYPQYPPQVPQQPQIPIYQLPKGTDAPITLNEKHNRLCFNRNKFPDLKLPEEKPKFFLIPSGDSGKFSVVAVPTRYNPVVCFPVTYRGKVPILHLPARNPQSPYNPYGQQQQFPFPIPGLNGQSGFPSPFANDNPNQYYPGANIPVPIDIEAFLKEYGQLYPETASPPTPGPDSDTPTTPSIDGKNSTEGNSTIETGIGQGNDTVDTNVDGGNQTFLDSNLNGTFPDASVNGTVGDGSNITREPVR